MAHSLPYKRPSGLVNSYFTTKGGAMNSFITAFLLGCCLFLASGCTYHEPLRGTRYYPSSGYYQPSGYSYPYHHYNDYGARTYRPLPPPPSAPGPRHGAGQYQQPPKGPGGYGPGHGPGPGMASHGPQAGPRHHRPSEAGGNPDMGQGRDMGGPRPDISQRRDMGGRPDGHHRPGPGSQAPSGNNPGRPGSGAGR